MAHEAEKPKFDTVLDVTAERIARTYADGFLGAARAAGDVRAALDELSSFVDDLLRPNPQFLAMLRSEFLSHDERAAVLDRVIGGQASPVVLNTLKVMSAHGRMGIVPSVAKQAREIWNNEQGRRTVEVVSAAPLGKDLIAEIENLLRGKLGFDPVIEATVDEDLIAGLSIRIGDTVYDGSLRTQLAKARRAMVDRAIGRIELHSNQFIETAS